MFDWDGHHHPFGRERVTPMVVLAAWLNWWSAPATSAWTNASATTRALPALVVWREAAVQAWRLAVAWMLAATEGTVNATGCPWPMWSWEYQDSARPHAIVQTYLCRVRKGSGSSLFDFDQVCCINFGDVGRLNLEEAVLIVSTVSGCRSILPCSCGLFVPKDPKV